MDQYHGEGKLQMQPSSTLSVEGRAEFYDLSVEGGKVYQNLKLGEGASGILPQEHSVHRGKRKPRKGVYTVLESSGPVVVGMCQIAARKDQDRYSIHLDDETGLMPHVIGVYDGHGTSATAADICADRMVKDSFSRHIATEYPPKGDMISDDHIIDTFVGLDKMVAEMQHMHPRTGSCATVLFISTPAMAATTKSGKIIVKCAWVGDSRAVMCGQHGHDAKAITVDHRVSDNQSEVDRINKSNLPPRQGLLESPGWAEEVRNAANAGIPLRQTSFVGHRTFNGVPAGPKCVFSHTGGISLQISRTIGDPLAARSCIPVPEITVMELGVKEFARFIIASDGVWDVVESIEACKLLAKTPNAGRAARKLARIAKKRRGYGGRTADDITVAVVDLNPIISELEMAKMKNQFNSSRDGKTKKNPDSCSIM